MYQGCFWMSWRVMRCLGFDLEDLVQQILALR